MENKEKKVSASAEEMGKNSTNENLLFDMENATNIGEPSIEKIQPQKKKISIPKRY